MKHDLIHLNLASLAGLGVFLVLAYGCEQWNEVQRRIERDNEVLKLVKATVQSWRATAKFPLSSENDLSITLIIHNESNYKVKDISISCTCKTRSGTEVGGTKTNTIFDIIEPYASKIFKNVDMGKMHEQTNSVSCKVINLKVVE